MNHLFIKQFKSPLAHLAAFLVIIFFSMLVAAYSYVQAKQIKIEADLLIAGEVRTSNLCIGGSCRNAWPEELLNGDITAAAFLAGTGWATICDLDCSGRNWVRKFEHSGWYNEHDPRNIVDKFPSSTYTCWNWQSCTRETRIANYSLQCNAPWYTDTSSIVPSMLRQQLGPCITIQQSMNAGCQAALCRPPGAAPLPPPPPTPGSDD